MSKSEAPSPIKRHFCARWWNKWNRMESSFSYWGKTLKVALWGPCKGNLWGEGWETSTSPPSSYCAIHLFLHCVKQEPPWGLSHILPLTSRLQPWAAGAPWHHRFTGASGSFPSKASSALFRLQAERSQHPIFFLTTKYCCPVSSCNPLLLSVWFPNTPHAFIYFTLPKKLAIDAVLPTLVTLPLTISPLRAALTIG